MARVYRRNCIKFIPATSYCWVQILSFKNDSTDG
uniref:Uncharacterized protein n=1 Tax=Anguilla anguilla TaxID=7936 RepID=A0A0E9QNW7_ANGAN